MLSCFPGLLRIPRRYCCLVLLSLPFIGSHAFYLFIPLNYRLASLLYLNFSKKLFICLALNRNLSALRSCFGDTPNEPSTTFSLPLHSQNEEKTKGKIVFFLWRQMWRRRRWSQQREMRQRKNGKETHPIAYSGMRIRRIPRREKGEKKKGNDFYTTSTHRPHQTWTGCI